MKVFIETVESPIAELIYNACGDVLSAREIKLIEHCQLLSHQVWVGSCDGEFVCAWGLAPPSLMSTHAYLWLYTTPAVKQHQFLFVRHSQRMVEHMLMRYDCIVGHVAADAEDSQRWLKWLGAEFLFPTGKLIPFRIKRTWPHP